MAGGVVEGVLVAGGAAVVLAAIRLSRRASRPAAAPAPPAAAADPFAEPVAERLPPEPPPPPAGAPERRALPRAAVVRPVLLRRDGAGTAQRRTFALDLGPGGVLLAGPADLGVGEALELTLELDVEIGARARVVRETPDGRKALAFESLDDGDRAAIARFVGAQPA